MKNSRLKMQSLTAKKKDTGPSITVRLHENVEPVSLFNGVQKALPTQTETGLHWKRQLQKRFHKCIPLDALFQDNRTFQTKLL